MASVKYAGRNYIIEIAVIMLLYVAVVWLRPTLLGYTDNATAIFAIKLLPAVPIWLMLVAVWRFYRSTDEYQQKKFLETLAISFGVGSCLIATYSFLADAGLPELAITWAWPTLAVTWALTSAVRGMVCR